MRFDVHPTAMKQKQGAPLNGERPVVHIAVICGFNRKFYRQRNSQRPVCDMQFTVVANESNHELQGRVRPIGNALFLFVCGLASFGFDHNAGGFILRQKADSRFVAARRGYEMVYLSCDPIIYIA